MEVVAEIRPDTQPYKKSTYTPVLIHSHLFTPRQICSAGKNHHHSYLSHLHNPFHSKQATYQATIEHSGTIAGPIPQRQPNPPRPNYPFKQPLNEASNTAEQAPSRYASPFQRTFPFKQLSEKVSNTADMMAGPLLSRLHMSTSRFGQTPPTTPEPTHTLRLPTRLGSVLSLNR